MAKASLVAVVVAIVDFFIHAGHFGFVGQEAIVTGVSTACLAFGISMTLLYARIA
jgi:hypothetical protein